MAITSLADYKAARKQYLSYMMPNITLGGISNTYAASFTSSVQTWPGEPLTNVALVAGSSGGKVYAKSDIGFPKFSDPTSSVFIGACSFISPAAVISTTATLNRIKIIDLYWAATFNNLLTTAQSVTGFPSYLRANTTGAGLSMGVITNDGTLALGAVITIGYTNSAGVAGRTASFTLPVATANSSQFIPVFLQSGDIGVQSVQSYQQSVANSVSGANLNSVVLFDEICTIAPAVITSPFKRYRPIVDIFSNGLTEIDTDAALSFLFGCNSPASDRRRGSIELVYG